MQRRPSRRPKYWSNSRTIKTERIHGQTARKEDREEAFASRCQVPGEDIPAFYAEMAKVINDPAVKVVPIPATRPASPASRLDTEMYRALERVSKRMYPNAAVIPSMSTGASDQAQLRAKGIQSYGLGPASTDDDTSNYGAHGDVERLSESSLYPFVEFVWNAVIEVAAHK